VNTYLGERKRDVDADGGDSSDDELPSLSRILGLPRKVALKVPEVIDLTGDINDSFDETKILLSRVKIAHFNGH
jgi:hypothetical protein